MRERSKGMLSICMDLVELGMALFMAVIVILWMVKIAVYSRTIVRVALDSYMIQNILSECFNLVIIIEFIRMLIMHDMHTVIEGLLFAIARTLIVGHGAAIETLVLVMAISLLLLNRKYLVREHEEPHHYVRWKDIFHIDKLKKSAAGGEAAEMSAESEPRFESIEALRKKFTQPEFKVLTNEDMELEDEEAEEE